MAVLLEVADVIAHALGWIILVIVLVSVGVGIIGVTWIAFMDALAVAVLRVEKRRREKAKALTPTSSQQRDGS